MMDKQQLIKEIENTIEVLYETEMFLESPMRTIVVAGRLRKYWYSVSQQLKEDGDAL